MTEKIEVIRRLRAGQSIRSIRRETGMHRTGARALGELAMAQGWLDADAALPHPYELERALSRQNSGITAHPLDTYREKIESWVKDETSYVAIQQLVNELYVSVLDVLCRQSDGHAGRAPFETSLSIPVSSRSGAQPLIQAPFQHALCHPRTTNHVEYSRQSAVPIIHEMFFMWSEEQVSASQRRLRERLTLFASTPEPSVAPR